MKIILIFFIYTSFAFAKNTVNNVAPHVIQRGIESTILVYGHRLKQIKQFLAYTPGIEMVGYKPVKERLDFHYFKMNKVKEGEAIALTLEKVSEDCALGRHLFRLRTNETLSEMRAIWVSPSHVLMKTLRVMTPDTKWGPL